MQKERSRVGQYSAKNRSPEADADHDHHHDHDDDDDDDLMLLMTDVPYVRNRETGSNPADHSSPSPSPWRVNSFRSGAGGRRLLGSKGGAGKEAGVTTPAVTRSKVWEI
jgi:hypothetical protein